MLTPCSPWQPAQAALYEGTVVADAAGARPALESLGWGEVVQPDEP